VERPAIAVLGSGLIATGYWPGERGPFGRIIEPRKAKIEKVLRRTPGPRVVLRLSTKFLASSRDNRMEGIRIHIRRLKHYVLIRAITDADRIRNNKMQQDKTSIPMSDSEPHYFEKSHKTYLTGLGKESDEFSESLESRVIMTSQQRVDQDWRFIAQLNNIKQRDAMVPWIRGEWPRGKMLIHLKFMRALLLEKLLQKHHWPAV
jgi:hypothetical protein